MKRIVAILCGVVLACTPHASKRGDKICLPPGYTFVEYRSDSRYGEHVVLLEGGADLPGVFRVQHLDGAPILTIAEHGAPGCEG